MPKQERASIDYGGRVPCTGDNCPHCKALEYKGPLDTVAEQLAQKMLDDAMLLFHYARHPRANHPGAHIKRDLLLMSSQNCLLTMQEAAERAGVSEKTIYNWIQSGQLEYFQFGRTVRIPSEALMQYQRKERHA